MDSFRPGQPSSGLPLPLVLCSLLTARRRYLISRYFDSCRLREILRLKLTLLVMKTTRRTALFVTAQISRPCFFLPGWMMSKSTPCTSLSYVLITFISSLFFSPAADWQIGGYSVIRPSWPSFTSRSSSSLLLWQGHLWGLFFFLFKTQPHSLDLSRGSKVGDEAEPEALELSDARIRTAALCKSKGANLTLVL